MNPDVIAGAWFLVIAAIMHQRFDSLEKSRTQPIPHARLRILLAIDVAIGALLMVAQLVFRSSWSGLVPMVAALCLVGWEWARSSHYELTYKTIYWHVAMFLGAVTFALVLG